MSRARKKLKRNSTGWMLIAAGIILLINYLSGFVYYRLDLTAEKRYSLAPVTREALRNLDDVVYIKVYLDGALPAGFLRLKNAINEILDEFRIYGRSNIRYEFINPADEEDLQVRRELMTQLYEAGLQPTNLQVKDKEGGTSQKIIFPGAIISYGGVDVAVNLLRNNPSLHWERNLNHSIQSLEFEFINMIMNLSSEEVKKIAFIEGHGELDQYQTGDITKELANFYQVDRGVIGGMHGVLDEYQAVIIAKPVRPFPEPDKFVIDQYIMNGGKVLWLIDPVQVSLDSLYGASTYALYAPLNLEDQLFRYGVRLNPNLVRDIQCHVIPVNKGLAGGQENWQLSPWYYYPVVNPGQDHIITKNLNLVLFEFASVIDTVGDNSAVSKTVLLSTSPYTDVVPVPAQISLAETDAAPDRDEYDRSFQTLAVLLEGRFQSVFTNRPVPEGVRTTGDRTELSFRERSEETRMIVVADGDVIANEVSMSREGPVIGQLGVDPYTSQSFGNKDLVLNAVNYLTDQTGLMELRGREFRLRLLDKQKIAGQELYWKLLNTILPVLLVVVLGLAFHFLRVRRYARADRQAENVSGDTR